jgi:hypothetical protein
VIFISYLFKIFFITFIQTKYIKIPQAKNERIKKDTYKKFSKLVQIKSKTLYSDRIKIIIIDRNIISIYNITDIQYIHINQNIQINTLFQKDIFSFFILIFY